IFSNTSIPPNSSLLFYPAPRGARHQFVIVRCSCCNISIHTPLAGRDGMVLSITTEYTYFNPHARAYKNIDRENTFFFNISALRCVLYNATGFAVMPLPQRRGTPAFYVIHRTVYRFSIILAYLNRFL
ncbi:MAG: hypothetical protein RSA41_07810, partial [Christensenella sp.]